MRFIILLLFIIFAASCTEIKRNDTGLYKEVMSTSNVLGTVSVSLYNSIGLKRPNEIRCQLMTEAAKMFPGCKGIGRIRYDKHAAYADVTW